MNPIVPTSPTFPIRPAMLQAKARAEAPAAPEKSAEEKYFEWKLKQEQAKENAKNLEALIDLFLPTPPPKQQKQPKGWGW